MLADDATAHAYRRDIQDMGPADVGMAELTGATLAGLRSARTCRVIISHGETKA